MNIDSDYQLPNIQTCQQSPEPIGPDSISSLITPKQSSSSNPFSYEGEADCLLKQNPNNDRSEAQQVSEEPQKISTEDPVNREINNPENTEASDHNFALRLQAELNGWTGDAYAQNAFPAVRYDLEGGVSEETRLFHVALPEAKVYLMQVTGLFITLIITSLCALLPLDDIAYAVIVTFPPLIYCFTWIFLEVRCRSQILGDLWLENGEFFKSFDMANIMILIVVMQFKFMGLTSSCVYAPLFFYSIAHVFVYTSKGLLRKRLPEILTRYLYATQVLIMVLRADEYTDQSWSWVFLLSWIFLAIKVFNYLKSMLNLLRKIISTTSSEDAFTNSLGFVWQVGFKGLIFVPLMALNGFTVYRGPEKDFRVIQEVAIFTFIVNVMLLATTLLRKERVLSFIVKMELFTSRLLEYERSLLNANIEVKNEVSFEMKKKEEYFVMLSPTYFKPINQGPFAKIKDVVLKNKTKLFKLTAAGNKAKLISQDDDIEKLKHDIKTLRNVNDLEGGSGNKFQTTVFEDSSCYICCLNPSNVVLMGCGHGGVCYDCAVSHIKKKNECMECRKEVDGIYKIQQSSKVFEIVKGYELHKVCK